MVFFKREHPDADELGRLELFAGLSTKELERVAELGQRISMRAGETVMLERFHGEQFLVILDGSVDVTRGGEALATLGVGEFVGEMGLLHHADRSATVTASSDVKFLAFDADAFELLMSDHPDIARRVEAIMDARTGGGGDS
jgi:CRP-like cAMP-binding protein